MKVVIPGGTGHLGRVLARGFREQGHQVVVLTRTPSEDPDTVTWDGRTWGPWVRAVDGADAVVNLAGRSVNCRYNAANLREMMDSRVLSTQVVGQAIADAARPPRVWLQMSTATIYAHRYDAPNDEATGRIEIAPDRPVPLGQHVLPLTILVTDPAGNSDATTVLVRVVGLHDPRPAAPLASEVHAPETTVAVEPETGAGTAVDVDPVSML